jgi:hypothetical protein
MLADMIAEIELRNQLRREASLPRLSVSSELRRLKTAQRKMEFESFCENEWPKYSRLCSGQTHGGMGGYVIWARIRQRIAGDFEAKKFRGQT